MGKLWVEVCLISARGLRLTSALWKLQWFAVGWIDTNNKYCTRIDASGNANRVWKTKFSTVVDPSEPNFQDMALHVEVYSREPIFLRERLLGMTTVILKEFLEKYFKNSEVSNPVEEVGSFQLRKKNTNKPRRFVDISIRISEEREESSSYQGDEEGFKLMDNSMGINLDIGHGPLHSQFPAPSPLRQEVSRRQAASMPIHFHFLGIIPIYQLVQAMHQPVERAINRQELHPHHLHPQMSAIYLPFYRGQMICSLVT
ncbi:uncharacterized protein [Coffea arabica]|uniref:Uncharacterized protein isoform X1 n=1 Tax=Coffea arabica TaxID=13443 RepID=A0ABM4WDD1_COFAR|nr:uncharacterized protein LOC113725218 isoform X1 [Coffea arabica]